MAKSTTPKAKKLKESFEYTAPEASAVMLAGSFTDWQSNPIPLKKSRKGTWKATVSLEPGTYEYRFLVDGSWCNDPSAPAHTVNPFGTQNCLRKVAVQ